MKILLLEDDENWVEQISAELNKCFKSCEITRIRTEWSFRKFIKRPDLPKWDIAILDIMIRWADYSEIMDHDAMADIPLEVEAEFDGKVKWRQGVRCKRLLLDELLSRGSPRIPVIFFTVLGASELKEDIQQMNGDTPLVIKSGAGSFGHFSELISAIRKHK